MPFLFIGNLNPTQQTKRLSNSQINGTYEWDNKVLLAFLDPLLRRMISLKCLHQLYVSLLFFTFFPRLGKLFDIEQIHTQLKTMREVKGLVLQKHTSKLVTDSTLATEVIAYSHP